MRRKHIAVVVVLLALTIGFSCLSARDVSAMTKEDEKIVIGWPDWNEGGGIINVPQLSTDEESQFVSKPNDMDQYPYYATATTTSAFIITDIESSAYNKLTVRWSSVDGADGYLLYRKNGIGKFDTLKNLTGTTYYTNTVTSGVKNTYKVAAYRLENGNKVIIGETGEASGTALPAAPVFCSANMAAFNKIRLIWNKVNGCEGYVIYRSESKNDVYSVLKTVTQATATNYVNVVRDSKTYYYKIRAFVTVDGKKVYGNYSNIMTGNVISGPPNNFAYQKSTATKVVFSWDKVEDADGYVIYIYYPDTEKYKAVKNITDNGVLTYTKKLAKNEDYSYAIRSYRLIDGVKVYSEYESNSHKHSLTETKKASATCTKEGNIAYWYCSGCKKYYSDANATKEISKEATIVPANGHTPIVDPAVPATYDSTGLTEGSHCGVCGKVLIEQKEIPVLVNTRHLITYRISGNNSYLASIEVNNPNPSYYVEGVGLKLKELEVPGYIFEGWYDGQSSNANRVTRISATEKEDIILYAHWSVDSSNNVIQFDCGDAPLITVDPITYDTSRGVTLPTPKLTNYSFVGWTDNDGNIVREIKPGTSGSITLHANWSSYRNRAKPKDYEKEEPIILEDSENGIILFTYELGTIENIPLYQVGKTINAVSGITKTTTETVSDSISTETASSITKAISEATTNSAAWALSQDWNECTSVNEVSAQQKGVDITEAEQRAKTSSDTYSVNSSKGGSKTATDSSGYSYALSGEKYGSNSVSLSVEEGRNFDLNINEKTSTEKETTGKLGGYLELGASNELGGSVSVGMPWEVTGLLTGIPVDIEAGVSDKFSLSGKLGASGEIAHTKKDAHELSGELELSGYSNKKAEGNMTSGWRQGVSENWNQSSVRSSSSNWNTSSGYSTSNEVSNSSSISKALSEIISTTKGYGKEISNGGSNSQNQSFSASDTSSQGWSDTVTYNSGQIVTKSETVTLSGEVEGFYRTVCAGTAHVFAVVGYDVAKRDYFVTTYSVMDDKTYLFVDYSKTTPNFDDNEKGVLPFEIPYFVNNYVNCKIAITDGLVVSKSGMVTGYAGNSPVVFIPTYYSFDNQDGTYQSIKIKGITPNAFKGNNSIVSVWLGDYITEIPDGAFEDCKNLKDVFAPALTKIGNNAFAGCSALRPFNVSQSINILGSNAFNGVDVVLVSASNNDVVKSATASGAKNIILNVSDVNNFTPDTTLVIPEGTDAFEIQGGRKDYSNLRIESHADETIINGINFVNCSRTAFEASSEELILNQVKINSSGYGMVLTHPGVDFKLYGDSYISSTGSNAVLCKGFSLSALSQSIASGLKIKGNVLTCGSVNGNNYLAFESGEVINISESDYDLYKRGTCVVTFDPNGGSLSDAERSRTSFIGTAIGDLPIPRKDNYTFDGWYTHVSGGNRISSDYIVNAVGSQAFYAHWTVNRITLTFNANGGSVSPGSKTLNYGDVYGDLPTPNRANYAFNGWFTAASGGTRVTDQTKVTSSDNITIYAQWSVNRITLSYNADGGSVSPGSKTLNYGDAYGDLPTPIRDYYTFDGWYTVASGGSRVDSQTKVTSSDNITIYAHWTQKPIKGWNRASEMPSGAQVTETKWSYTLREYTSNSSSSLSGWTMYERYRSDWGSWQGPLDYDPGNGERDVRSESYVTKTWYHYYRYSTGWSASGGSDIATNKYGRNWYEYVFDYELWREGTDGNYSRGYRYYYTAPDGNTQSGKYMTVWKSDPFVTQDWATHWYYRDPIYTYNFYRDVNKETAGGDPSGQANVSNVVKWVKYREK